jgi:hypothetical protein
MVGGGGHIGSVRISHPYQTHSFIAFASNSSQKLWVPYGVQLMFNIYKERMGGGGVSKEQSGGGGYSLPLRNSLQDEPS